MSTRPATQFIAITLVCLMAMSIVACSKPHENTGSAPLGSAGLEVGDRDVTTRVKAALKGDERLKGFDIAVVTTKGDLRLTGLVDNQSQIDHVFKLARSIEGAQAIHDELAIKK
jgi:osmotically-inducible protein OsmY